MTIATWRSQLNFFCIWRLVFLTPTRLVCLTTLNPSHRTRRANPPFGGSPASAPGLFPGAQHEIFPSPRFRSRQQRRHPH